VLYVRGSGDPFLISPELAPLATKLVAAVDKKAIAGTVLDEGFYPSNPASRASRTPTRPTMR
jgi:hypothetical protein